MILRKREFLKQLKFSPFLCFLRQVSSRAISTPEHAMFGNVCFRSEKGEAGADNTRWIV